MTLGELFNLLFKKKDQKESRLTAVSIPTFHQGDKVFCRACKYFETVINRDGDYKDGVFTYYDGYYVCKNPIFSKEELHEDDPIDMGSGRVRRITYPRCQEINEKNNCKKFEARV